MEFFQGLEIKMANADDSTLVLRKRKPLYYGIQYTHSGPLHLRVDNGREFHVEGSYAFITSPEHHFEYGTEEGRKRYQMYICFTGPRVAEYRKKGLLPTDYRSPLIKVNEPEKFLHRMNEFILAFKSGKSSNDKLTWMLEGILLKLVEQSIIPSNFPVFYREKFENLAKQIDAHPEKEYHFELIARELSLSHIYFRQLFRIFSGMAPQQYLIHSRLNKASSLLLATSQPVSEIAALTGWKNEFYFSRIFKKKYGISPKSYRETYD